MTDELIKRAAETSMLMATKRVALPKLIAKNGRRILTPEEERELVIKQKGGWFYDPRYQG